MNDELIEKWLRQAPRPTTPATLRTQLLNDIPFGERVRATESSINTGNWPRHWFPALSFGVLCMGCLLVLATGTLEFLSLKREQDRLLEATSNLERLRVENTILRDRQQEIDLAKTALADYRELLNLREEAKQWREFQQSMQILQDEKKQLEALYAEALEAIQTARGPDPFAEALEEAHATECINNMKQILLAAIIWSDDPERFYQLPKDFLALSEEYPNPRILVCPADAERVQAQSWDQFNPANVSYRMLSPGAPHTDPNIVYIRCPIHGYIGMTDGSVNRVGLDAKLMTEDGVTRLDPTSR